MAIQTVDLTVPNGDTPRSANTKINLNFTDQTNAASRLVGLATGNVMEVGAFGLGYKNNEGYRDLAVLPLPESSIQAAQDFIKNNPTGFFKTRGEGEGFILGSSTPSAFTVAASFVFMASGYNKIAPQYTYVRADTAYNKIRDTETFWTTQNATKDPNGFLKGASPIAEIYSNSMELNRDAILQGDITFEKLAVGDYLIKGSLGFALEGWYIETPKDANGNVLVAVVYKQLANNDISVKTYAKRFDEDTGDIVANLTKPRDIPAGRFISLRLHELPVEPAPVPVPAPEK